MNSILLREAYAYIAAVPDTAVRLDRYRSVDDCGNVSGCLLGHLAMAGFAGLFLDADGCLHAEGVEEEFGSAWDGIAARFGLTRRELIDLVGYRTAEECLVAGSDKELILARFSLLFSRHDLELHSRGYYLHLENV